MKKIEKIKLDDATKLSRKEMKSIKAGWWEDTNSHMCSGVCYNHTGTIVGSTQIDCTPYLDKSPNARCIIEHEGNKLTAKCYNGHSFIAQDTPCENITSDEGLLPPRFL